MYCGIKVSNRYLGSWIGNAQGIEGVCHSDVVPWTIAVLGVGPMENVFPGYGDEMAVIKEIWGLMG